MSMKLDADALSHLKVKDLQRELKKRGLDTAGLKASLLQRLKEHLQKENESKPEEETEQQEEEKTDEFNDKKEEKAEGNKELEAGEKNESVQEQDSGSNGGEDYDKSETAAGVKRGASAIDKNEDAPEMKKAKVTKEMESVSPQPEDEDGDKRTPTAAANGEKATAGDTTATEKEHRKTLRIDNFVRPFTLNAVKALVQESGDYVENGFWMDAIKTHCFVTYPSSDIAETTRAALDGKLWPPENGRSLSAKLIDHTAMEVSQYGETNLLSRPKRKDSNGTQAQRQKVTIDEFFQKTETKPVLYYLALTDEQIKERKQRQSQQPEDQPRKRRHRGGRKRNRRRFRR